MADEAVCVGPAPSAQSYLNVDAIMDAIQQTGAQAVHPGYGFLSENAAFCDRLEQNGIAFIGPKQHAITSMGDKIASKQIARDAKVNTIPGWLGQVESPEQVVEVAREIGYPVMVKASAGGGGKGMRVAYNDQEARESFILCQQEAQASFGDDTIFLEKFIERPRHIELQVLLDGHGNGVYLNERECSIQRRNQKVIEEAPSTFLDPETRRAMGEQALALARAVDYQSAGTVEFLVDKNKDFYFLEMNTRLQVEHPISELITGVDIVEQMIRIAAGHPLPFRQEDIGINGWAIESRVYAEDPLNNFLPSIGHLRRYREPTGTGVRVDSGIREGSEISIHYDPMISKLVTHGGTREEALERMRNALDNYVIGGLRHNVSFLRSLCDHPSFIAGDLTTNFIPEHYPDGYRGPELGPRDLRNLVSGALNIHLQRLVRRLHPEQLNIFRWAEQNLVRFYVRFPDNTVYRADSQIPIESTEELLDAFETGNGEFIFRLTRVEEEEEDLEENSSQKEENDALESKKVGDFGGIQGVESEEVHFYGDYHSAADTFQITVAAAEADAAAAAGAEDGGQRMVETTATLQASEVTDASSRYILTYLGVEFPLEVYNEPEFRALQHMPVKESLNTEKLTLSPMPGKIISVAVQPGDTVVPGQEVCVIEAMKMQNSLRAEAAGTVKAVNVKVGDTVSVEEILIEFD